MRGFFHCYRTVCVWNKITFQSDDINSVLKQTNELRSPRLSINNVNWCQSEKRKRKRDYEKLLLFKFD